MKTSACRRSSSATIGGWRRDGGDDGDSHAAALHRFDQRTEIAVAGEQHDLIDVFGDLHRIDRELDSMLPLTLRRPLVDEFLGRLGDDGIAVVIQPIDQRADRRIFLILDDRCVIERANEIAADWNSFSSRL